MGLNYDFVNPFCESIDWSRYTNLLGRQPMGSIPVPTDYETNTERNILVVHARNLRDNCILYRSVTVWMTVSYVLGWNEINKCQISNISATD